MTQDEIIRMAREAELYRDIDEVERFAAIVAANEREACAKLMEDMAAQDRVTNYYKVAANAIRARGEK